MIPALDRWVAAGADRTCEYRLFNEGGLALYIYTLRDPGDRGPQEFSGKSPEEARAELHEFLEPAQRELFEETETRGTQC